MPEPTPRPTKTTIQSEHFRMFAADTYGLRLTNHSAQLSFLLETLDLENREFLLKEATAVLSLPSLKVLQIVLTNALAVAEKQFGPVTLPPGKEEELRAVLPVYRPAEPGGHS
jgi:hypothetical protein